jgi:hypothetical protein
MIKNNERLYKGKAGQLYIMSLLLARGWNVAIPEVDTGDDIFVVKDRSGDFRKVQVKTTYSFLHKNADSLKVKFNIPGEQLLLEQPVELIYIFVVLLDMKFYPDILIIERNQLEYSLTLLKEKITTGNINFYLDFSDKGIFSQSLNLTEYRNNFSSFPSQF